MADGTRVCSVDGCAGPHQARGLCQSHYSKAARRRAKGGPKLPPKRRPRPADLQPITCAQCGETRQAPRGNAKFCSMACRDRWRGEKRVNPHPPAKSDIQRALRAADWPALLVAIEAESTRSPLGCWLWRSVATSGYGAVRMDRTRYAAHRLAVMAVRGGDLDASMPVHHMCAVKRCVNPDHLQVVTHIENTAEMFERKFYRQRIALLERALADLDSEHPLLRGL